MPSRCSAVSVSCRSWTGFEPAAAAAAARGAAAGAGDQRVVVDELVAVGDQQVARRFAVADADDALVELAQLADQRREVAVAGDDDEVVDVLAAVGQLHRVDGHLDVGAVLGALARRGHLDEPEPGVLQLVARVAVAAPVRVGALHEHAPLLREAVEDQVDVEVASSLGPGSGHVLEVDQHGERALVLGQGASRNPMCGRRSGGVSSGVSRIPRVRRTSPMVPGGAAIPPPGALGGAASLESRGPRAPAGATPASRESCMTTQQSTATTPAAGDSGAETLTITDNRTGISYELPIADGTIRATELRQIKVDEDDFGLMTYDPAFMNTASCRSAVTYLDGDAGILRYRGYPIEQLAEKSSFLEVAYLLVFGDLPTAEQLDGWVHDITHHTFVHENVKGADAGLPLRRPPDGDAPVERRGAQHLLPRGQGDPGRGQPLPADRPPHRQDADPRRLGVPAHERDAVRLPGERALLLGELPVDALHHRGQALRARPPHRAGPGRAVHPPRRPRAELLDERGTQRGLVAGRPVLGRRRRGRGALWPAARGRQRGGAADAPPHRDDGQHPGLHRGREGRPGAPDGLRPPGLQELRPAGDDHQEGLRRRLRRDRGQPAAGDRGRARADRARGRLLRQRASSTPTSTSTAA